MTKIFICAILMLGLNHAYAVTLKIGVLAPEGTTWAKNVMQMVKEIEDKTAGEVKLRVYYGGVQGDEPDVLRKIRIGQLHGGIFTGRALGEINGDVRVVELPFTFGNDREKAWELVTKMKPFFDEGFKKNGFINLGFFELGLVYLISQRKISTLEDIKGLKIWSWSGDKLAEAIASSMELVSVPLALPDVLSSLSTGIINAAYNTPLGVVALQWHTKIKYMVDYPLAFATGAFLVSSKGFDKIPAKHRQAVKEIATKYTALANKGTIKENSEAKSAMAQMGIEVLSVDKSNFDGGAKHRKEIIKMLTDKLFSQKALDKMELILKK